MKTKILRFFQKPIYIYVIYLAVGILSALAKYGRGPLKYNNYLIFKNVFYNTIHENNLYSEYPELYFDKNHYGIIFSALIAPFTLFPDWLGMVLWNLANVGLFIYAIQKLPVSEKQKAFFAWLCLQELITALVSFQFNVALTGLIILSACFIYQKQEIKSAFSILIGFFVKIYGIVGLSSFFFVQRKARFILGLFAGAILLFALPMLYASPGFVVQSYADWIHELVIKNEKNTTASMMQDISLMGFFRRITNTPVSNLVFLAIGLPIFALPYLRFRAYDKRAFQLLILASTLLFTVLFSSGSESPTYIIAVAGVMLWYIIRKEKSAQATGLVVFVLILTSFGMSDLFPVVIKRDYIVKYALKALPCILVWLQITYELLFFDMEKDYNLLDQ